MGWVRGRRRLRQAILTVQTYEAAVKAVTTGTQDVRWGTLVFHRTGGGFIVIPDSFIGGAIQAAIHINLLKHYAPKGWKVRLVVYSAAKGRSAQSGAVVRRADVDADGMRTFKSDNELLTWRETPEGRLVVQSDTFRWYVYATPQSSR